MSIPKYSFTSHSFVRSSARNIQRENAQRIRKMDDITDAEILSWKSLDSRNQIQLARIKVLLNACQGASNRSERIMSAYQTFLTSTDIMLRGGDSRFILSKNWLNVNCNKIKEMTDDLAAIPMDSSEIRIISKLLSDYLVSYKKLIERILSIIHRQ